MSIILLKKDQINKAPYNNSLSKFMYSFGKCNRF